MGMLSAREQWLQDRRKGIGGSDAAAILGFSPWRTAMDVWLEKTELVPARAADPDRDFLLELGQRLEPVIAGLYERETGNQIVIPSQIIFHHTEYPELIGTPDRIGADCFMTDAPLSARFGVELKTENQFTDSFGDPGSDQVPQHYLIQCAHYMAVLNLPRWDVAVLHGGTRFNVYHIERDAELEGELIDQLRAWWREHVVNRTPPPVDASDGWRRYLHAKHPVENLPLVRTDDPAKQQLLGNLWQIRNAEKNLTALREETENQLKQSIGDAEGIYSNAGRATWKKTKDSTSVDWQAAFHSLARKYGTLREMRDEIIKPHISTRPGVRRFLFSPAKGTYGTQHAISNEQIGNALPAPAADPNPGNGERGVGSASESAD